jgi:hypothetical protein
MRALLLHVEWQRGWKRRKRRGRHRKRCVSHLLDASSASTAASSVISPASIVGKISEFPTNSHSIALPVAHHGRYRVLVLEVAAAARGGGWPPPNSSPAGLTLTADPLPHRDLKQAQHNAGLDKGSRA